MNLLICLEACKAELKRQSVVGKPKTTQQGKGLFCSALGTFSHTLCSTPRRVLCNIGSSPFVLFMEAFHNLYVAATAPKGCLSPSPRQLSLTGGPWWNSTSQPVRLRGLGGTAGAGWLCPEPLGHLPSAPSSSEQLAEFIP